jgi:hypothetical protein
MGRGWRSRLFGTGDSGASNRRECSLGLIIERLVTLPYRHVHDCTLRLAEEWKACPLLFGPKAVEDSYSLACISVTTTYGTSHPERIHFPELFISLILNTTVETSGRYQYNELANYIPRRKGEVSQEVPFRSTEQMLMEQRRISKSDPGSPLSGPVMSVILTGFPIFPGRPLNVAHPLRLDSPA